MPRQRIHHTRETYDFPDDFPQRLQRFQGNSGLSWSEIARRIGTYRYTVSRWKEGRGRPNAGQRSYSGTPGGIWVMAINRVTAGVRLFCR